MFHSRFKEKVDIHRFYEWVSKLEKAIGRTYHKFELPTMLGKTQVWALNHEKQNLPALVVFPGYRTSPLFWDLDNGLDVLIEKYRIFLVETNGQPNPSEGNTPLIRSDGYGLWAAEVVLSLGLQKCFVAGASFGGLVACKLCITSPELVEACFLLNPGCLQPFSLSPRNLYYNLLPILSPTEKNIQKFLEKGVFHKPEHTLTPPRMALAVAYQRHAITRYVDKAQKPYFMKDELMQVKSDIHLIVGEKDMLFPAKRSVSNARRYFENLQQVHVLPGVGHAIETLKKTHEIMLETMESHKKDRRSAATNIFSKSSS